MANEGLWRCRFSFSLFWKKKQIPSWTFFSGPNDVIQIALHTKKLKSKSHRIFKTKARRLTVSLGLNSSLTLSVDKLYMTGRSTNQKHDTSAIVVLKGCNRTTVGRYPVRVSSQPSAITPEISLISKFSKNLGSIPKAFWHVLGSSKHTKGFLAKKLALCIVSCLLAKAYETIKSIGVLTPTCSREVTVLSSGET